MSRYILSSDAEADVEEIIDYYLFENQSVYAAETVNREFHAAFRTLADSPGQGHLREDLTDKPFRFWRVRSCLIVYRPETTPIEVMAVLHGRRNVARLLKPR